MLYELFIAGQPVDLDNNISIPLNYTAIDTDTPTAEHGSYSKSVEIRGTANNNALFGQLFDLSRTISGDDYTVGGVSFDPRKRTDYVLWYNGEIVDRGYVKVDTVTKNNGDITYSCTLFSDLGDFFYNLMYSQDGEELTLGDLHYDLQDISGNTINEDTDTLFYWDKDYIYESWQALSGETDNSDRRVHRWITAAPTYGGFYDDFDSDSVLLNYDSLPVGGAARNILSPLFPSGTPSTYRGWIRCKGTRDMDEFEVRDLRSVNQRPAIKMSMILDAISNPDNNGGFEVEWDDEIKTSPYYTDTYLVLNRLNFELDEAANSVSSLGCSINQIINWTPEFNIGHLYDATLGAYATTFDLSNVVNPRISLSIDIHLDFDVFADFINTGVTFYTSYHPELMSYMGYYHEWNPYIYGGMVARLVSKKNGVVQTKSPTYLITTPTYNSNQPFGYGVTGWKSTICNTLGISEDELLIKENTVIWNDNVNRFTWSNPLHIDIELPREDGVSIDFEISWIWVSSSSVFTGGIGYPDGRGVLYYPMVKSDIILMNDEETHNTTGIYDGTIDPNIQKTNVTKSILFGESESPFKYLVGFTRMLGAKYRYDLAAKKIYIQTRKNYYLPEGHVIDGQIDRGQNVEIQPTLSEYKWYKYGLETPETYASLLYKRKNKYEYGEKKVDTGYYFNNDTNNLFDDIPYTNAIPYLQKSIYYAVYDGVPSILVSPTFDATNFIRDGGTIDEDTIKIKGYASYHTVNPLRDSSGNKLCCFDNDNNAVDDLTNCLVFYDGKKSVVDNYQLSDNIPIMGTLNDNPCYMFVSGNTTVMPSAEADTPVYVCYWLRDIPVFSKYLTENDIYTDSLDFVKPNYTFIDNYENYQDGITLYDRYWKGYIEDLYEANNKAVTVRMFLKEHPDLAMRKFYYFDNSVWVISEITDYDASKIEPTQVKFVKVTNTSNYTSDSVVFGDMYDDWHTPIIEYEYRWVLSDEYTCSGFNKYYLYKQQSRVVPANNNDGWADVGDAYSIDGRGTMPPVLAESNSFGCGYVAYRWVLSEETTCSGFDKYYVYKYQYMSGLTGDLEWRDFEPEVTSIDADGTMPPVIAERNSIDCGYVQNYWVITSATTCSGTDLYYLYQLYERYEDGGTMVEEPVVPAVYSIDADGTETPDVAVYCSSGCGAGSITIWTNNGSVTDCFENGTAPYGYYSGRTDIIKAEVQPTMRSVSDGLFKNCTNLSAVTLDGTGTFYGHVFQGCTNLKNVSIGSGYTQMQGWTFSGCTSLSSITIPDSITLIGGYSFNKCTNLREITFGSGLTQLNQTMFSGCTNLTSITSYATTAPTLQSNVFKGVASAGTLYYPCDSDYSAWSAALPSGWTDYCRAGSITIWDYSGNSSTDYFGKGIAPDGYYSRRLIKKAQINPKMSSVSNKLFSGCTYLSSVTISDTVKTIGKDAFNYCYSLTSIVVPDSVITIGNYAFYDCHSLTSLTIGNSVETIGNYAFYDCHSLTSVTIPDSVITIGYYAFYDCQSLTSVTIGNSVETIGEDAFSNCSGLTSLTIPDSVITIGGGAFSNCSSLTSLTIGNSVETIGDYALYNCYRLSSVTIPDSVITIGNYAFSGCSSLTSVTIGNGVETIGWGAFADLVRLTSVTIPDSVTTIYGYAFRNCSGLTSIVVPDSVITIGDEVFYNCYGLTNVTIGNGVETIGEKAFYNCNSLTSVTIGSGVTSIGEHVFEKCYGLTNVTIGDVKTIGNGAFSNCRSLTSIIIGSGVTSIGRDAFDYCYSLTSITCYATTAPTLIANDVFNGVPNAGTLYVPTGSNYSTWTSALGGGWTISYINT